MCSAGARRLVADGIWPNFPHLDDTAVANWFLQRWPDVRASDALELPATQFACQGLELDQVGLCWGNDLIRRCGRTDWVVRSFAGTRWQEPRSEAAIAYQVNTYRVLLTRARYETVIWIPHGDATDMTRQPAEFDAIAAFLQECGRSRPGDHAATLRTTRTSTTFQCSSNASPLTPSFRPCPNPARVLLTALHTLWPTSRITSARSTT